MLGVWVIYSGGLYVRKCAIFFEYLFHPVVEKLVKFRLKRLKILIILEVIAYAFMNGNFPS